MYEVACVRCIEVPMTAWPNFLKSFSAPLTAIWGELGAPAGKLATIIDHCNLHVKPLLTAESNHQNKSVAAMNRSTD
jgi:hypothetical protein